MDNEVKKKCECEACKPKPCPTCGTCPTCGRGPQWAPWWYHHQPYWYWHSTNVAPSTTYTSGYVNLTGSSTMNGPNLKGNG